MIDMKKIKNTFWTTVLLQGTRKYLMLKAMHGTGLTQTEQWRQINGEDYRYGGWYYFEPVTGTMMKGPVILEDGRKVFYDTTTGQMVKGEYTVNGQTYIFDENTGILQDTGSGDSLADVGQETAWEYTDRAHREKTMYDGTVMIANTEGWTPFVVEKEGQFNNYQFYVYGKYWRSHFGVTYASKI